jgi:hypothetical protein
MSNDMQTDLFPSTLQLIIILVPLPHKLRKIDPEIVKRQLETLSIYKKWNEKPLAN